MEEDDTYHLIMMAIMILALWKFIELAGMFFKHIEIGWK